MSKASDKKELSVQALQKCVEEKRIGTVYSASVRVAAQLPVTASRRKRYRPKISTK